MQLPNITLPPFLEKHKFILSGLTGAIVLALAGVYIVIMFTSDGGAVVKTNQNQSLLGEVSPSFIVFLQAMNSEKLSLKDQSFIDSYLVRNSHDYTQIINPSLSRGRLDPFSTYVAPGSTR